MAENDVLKVYDNDGRFVGTRLYSLPKTDAELEQLRADVLADTARPAVLEKMFERELRDLMRVWRTHGISAGRMAVHLQQRGPAGTARHYVLGTATRGFVQALQTLGPDCTIEGMVVREKYRALFSEELRQRAQAEIGAVS